MPILSVANLVAMSSHSVYRRLLCLVMTAALLALVHPPSQQPPGISTSLGPPFLCHDTLAWMSWGSFRPWLVDWAASVMVWIITYGEICIPNRPETTSSCLSHNSFCKHVGHVSLFSGVYIYKRFLWFISWSLMSYDFLFGFKMTISFILAIRFCMCYFVSVNIKISVRF